MAPNILAVAVKELDTGLLALSSPKVRPYIQGLQFGLSLNGYTLATSYTIEYHHRKASSLDAFFSSKASTLGANDIVFCMSTGVLDSAIKYITANAIVGVVSNYSAYAGKNVCGYSAQRVQQAADCYNNFKAMVPSLTEIRVLHQPHYLPSKNALNNIQTTCGVTLNTVDVTAPNDILAGLAGVPRGAGVLVLPIDRCFGEVDEIVTWQNDLTKNANKIPIFWPATDWVGTGSTTAFGGYGVPQEYCGYRMGEQVAYVWSNGGAIPPFEICKSDDIKWLASGQTAAALGVKLTAQAGLEIV